MKTFAGLSPKTLPVETCGRWKEVAQSSLALMTIIFKTHRAYILTSQTLGRPDLMEAITSYMEARPENDGPSYVGDIVLPMVEMILSGQEPNTKTIGEVGRKDWVVDFVGKVAALPVERFVPSGEEVPDELKERHAGMVANAAQWLAPPGNP